MNTELTVHGQKVAAKLYKPAEAGKSLAFLFLHGWTGRPNEDAAMRLAEEGYYALTIAMRGHAGSEGDIQTITAKDSLDDAIAAYDYFKDQVPAETRIAVVGNSYGCYIAVLMSEVREVAALSLRVPAAYPDEYFMLPKWGRVHDNPEVNAWRQKSIPFSDNKAFKLLHDFPGDIQILEAGQDGNIPHATVQNYIDAIQNKAKLDYHLMENWPHSLGTDPQRAAEFQELLLNWAIKAGTQV